MEAEPVYSGGIKVFLCQGGWTGRIADYMYF